MTVFAPVLLMLAALQVPPPLTVEAIRTTPAQMIAERLIGPEEAADVEQSEARWDRMLPGGAELRLFHRPVPFARDMCSRRVHVLSLLVFNPIGEAALPRDRQSLQVTHIGDYDTIALAPNCLTVPGQSFVHVNPGIGRHVVAQGLRDLAAARAAAAARDRLPFRLDCRDEARGPRNACRAGARRTLAALPTERAWMMDGDAAGVDIVIGEPGELQWRVEVARYGTDRARVSMIWFVPPPF